MIQLFKYIVSARLLSKNQGEFDAEFASSVFGSPYVQADAVFVPAVVYWASNNPVAEDLGLCVS